MKMHSKLSTRRKQTQHGQVVLKCSYSIFRKSFMKGINFLNQPAYQAIQGRRSRSDEGGYVPPFFPFFKNSFLIFSQSSYNTNCHKEIPLLQRSYCILVKQIITLRTFENFHQKNANRY